MNHPPPPTVVRVLIPMDGKGMLIISENQYRFNQAIRSIAKHSRYLGNDTEWHYWEVARTHPRRWFELRRWGVCVAVVVEAPHTERCTTGCQIATGPVAECACPCLGAFHGGGGDNWIEFGEYGLVRVDGVSRHETCKCVCEFNELVKEFTSGN